MQVQILPADVTKLSCEFLKQVVKIHNSYKTSLAPKDDKLNEAFANYVKASFFLPYLSPAQVHCLQDAANKLDEDSTNIESTSCEAQASVKITKSTFTASYGVRMLNTFATPYTVDNSTHIGSYIYLSTPLGNEKVEGGCISSGGSVLCDTVYNASVYNVIRYNLPSFIDYGNAYITKLKLYETDSSGNFYTSHIVNLDPATSPYYASAGVNPVDVKFSSSNFGISLIKLINAFSATRPSMASTSHYITPSTSGDLLTFVCQCNHYGRRILGINKDDTGLSIKSDIYGEMSISPSLISLAWQDARFFHKPSYTTNCGMLTPTITGTAGFSFDPINSNYNRIAFSSSTSTYTNFTLTGNTQTCQYVRLTASYSTIGEVTERYWTTSYDPTRLYSDSIDTNRTGSFYFTIVLDNGCTITKTYTMVDIPATSLGEDEIVA